MISLKLVNEAFEKLLKVFLEKTKSKTANILK